MNVNFIIKMDTSWIDRYCTDPNRDPDIYWSKNQFFMYWFLQISIMNKKNTEMIVFDLFIDIESNHEIQIYFFRFSWSRVWIAPPLWLKPQYREYKHMVDFTSRFLDPQQIYSQTLLGSDQSGKGSKHFTVKMDFVTTPVAFYLNFPKNRYFNDLGKALINILNLRCSDGPGWWVDAERCVKHDL